MGGSGEAIGRAGDALDLESRSVAPFVRIGAQALGARLTAEGDRLFRAHPRDEKVAGRDSRSLLTLAGTVTFRVRRYRDAEGRVSYPLYEETGVCAPREKASRGLKAFAATMACDMAYRPAAAHLAVFTRETAGPAAVKDALHACATAPLAAAEDGPTFADRFAGLADREWDTKSAARVYWGCDGERAYRCLCSIRS